MWQNYNALAEQRLRDLYADAAVRRALPRRPRGTSTMRTALGHALVRWGERLARPVGAPIAHR